MTSCPDFDIDDVDRSLVAARDREAFTVGTPVDGGHIANVDAVGEEFTGSPGPSTWTSREVWEASASRLPVGSTTTLSGLNPGVGKELELTPVLRGVEPDPLRITLGDEK